MQLLDWLITLLPFTVVVTVGLRTRRHMRSVADFMSGGRVAGPYLLAVSRGELEAGAVVFVAMFEIIRQAGFTLAWWQSITVPFTILVGISGFVVYRYRETRAMTLAQFFELRYSKGFRLFTGFLGFFAGIVNFGIIPAVGSRFLVYFLGLPSNVALFGNAVPTYIPLMAVLLGITLFLALSGGLVTVMVANCLEGIFTQVFYLIIIVALLWMFDWREINEVLARRPAGQSLLNPFDSLGLEDFNLGYVLMGLFGSVYGTMAWQNSSSYNAAAISPHASVMGGLLGRWRELGKGAVITMLAVCAMTFVAHPDFAEAARPVHEAVAQLESPQLQKQMELPIAVSALLPVGVKGVFCAVLLMGVFGGDSTHLHSWGGIFVQDVLVPLRKRPFGPKQHIRALRLAIMGVALFAFFFGALFRQTEYIAMWWTVTMAIYIGGAGACIIGGLYWKKGTTAGAWAALIAGSGLSCGGILARQVYGHDFPLNGTQISFSATLIAIALYIVVSLLTCRGDFDMDRLLHRVPGADAAPAGTVVRRKATWKRLVGIDGNFSRSDAWIAGGLFGWSLLWFAVFAAGSLWHFVAPWPAAAWTRYWHVVGIGIPIFLSGATAVWFTWGGTRDIRRLFDSLKRQRVNHLDDGTVVGHQNLDERAVEAAGGAVPVAGETAASSRR